MPNESRNKNYDVIFLMQLQFLVINCMKEKTKITKLFIPEIEHLIKTADSWTKLAEELIVIIDKTKTDCVQLTFQILHRAKIFINKEKFMNICNIQSYEYCIFNEQIMKKLPCEEFLEAKTFGEMKWFLQDILNSSEAKVNSHTQRYLLKWMEAISKTFNDYIR
jgi:hypothetical protein